MAPVQARILVVDDDHDCREAVAEFLEAQGYSVDVARDGLDALERLRGDHALVDLVLADLRMPRMDGEHLAEAIARDPRLRGIPVVAMTAALERPCPPAAAALVRKPFSPDGLLGTIAEILAAARCVAVAGP